MKKRIWGVVVVGLLGWSSLAGAGPVDFREMVLERVDGGKVRLADFQGQVVLVNFWATWCPPCLEEIPDLVRLQRTFGERPFTVVGINHLEDLKDLELSQFISEHRINYPILKGEAKTVHAVSGGLGGVYGLPTSYLLNRDGKVVYARKGTVDFLELLHMVEPLL